MGAEDGYAERRREQVVEMSKDKACVLQGLERIADLGLAVWNRNTDHEIELHFLTGEIFILSQTGITRL